MSRFYTLVFGLIRSCLDFLVFGLIRPCLDFLVFGLIRPCLDFLVFGFIRPCLEPMHLDLQLPVQSVPITNEVVSSNPVHGEVYSTTLCKFVSDLRMVGDFLRFPPLITLAATI
jgi:hypothetical protein